MDKITISIPGPMGDYVKARIASGQYGNVSEFFRDLVRRDQEKQSRAINELREMMDLAEASGISDQTGKQVIAQARQEARAKGLLDE